MNKFIYRIPISYCSFQYNLLICRFIHVIMKISLCMSSFCIYHKLCENRQSHMMPSHMWLQRWGVTTEIVFLKNSHQTIDSGYAICMDGKKKSSWETKKLQWKVSHHGCYFMTCHIVYSLDRHNHNLHMYSYPEAAFSFLSSFFIL